MSQSNKKTKVGQSAYHPMRSPKFISKRRGTKPLLSALTQEDSGNRLITPSSRATHFHSPVYKIATTPTFFTTDNTSKPKHDNDNDILFPENKSGNRKEKKTDRTKENKNDSNTLDTAQMRARYVSIRSRSIPFNSKKLLKLSNKKERERIVTKNFIESEMRQIAYSKYIRSPFGFIDCMNNSSIPSIEFVYLKENAPYDLEIVPSLDAVNKCNYYTLSCKGLTHFNEMDGITEVSFTPLDQWQREYYLFASMMDITFFKQYKIWKSFRDWKKCIQRCKIKKCKNLMNKNLFILNKQLRKPLFEIRKVCCSMTEWKLFVLKDTSRKPQPLSLEEFLNVQKKHRAVLKTNLGAVWHEIKIELLNACSKRLHVHLVESGFREKDAPQTHETSEDISHAERAAIRTECRSLTKFIKMVDSFIQNAVITLCRENVESLLKYIENVDKKNSIFLINLDVSMRSSQFILNPLCIDFEDAIRSVIHEAIAVVLSPPNFCAFDEDLARFTAESEVVMEAEDDNLIDLEQLLLNDTSFVNDIQEIQNGIVAAFDESMTWMASLTPYLDIYLSASPDTLSFEMTNAKKFDEYLSKYGGEMQELNAMPISIDIYMLRIDCKAIKDRFMPMPKERLKFIEDKLPEMAHSKCMELIADLSGQNDNIKKTPLTVSDFVRFKKDLNNVHLRDEEIEYRFNEINDMFLLINKHKIRLHKDTTKQHGKLHQIRSTLTTNVSISDSSIDDSTTKFVNYMKSAVPQLIGNIADIRSDMESQILARIDVHNLEDNIRQSIQYIQEHDDKLSKYEALANDYALYEEKLEIEITEYDRLPDTRNDLNMKKELWFATGQFHESCIEWKKCALNALNMDEMQNDIKMFLKLIGKTSRYLSPNADEEHAVVEYLKTNVFDLKKTMPIIEHLSSASLKERHWRELAETIGYDIYNDKAFTLGTIFSENLIKYEKEISFIAVQAAQEQSLIELLHKIVSIWKECDMPLHGYKDYKQCYILGGLDDIIGNLDESLVTIATINSSRYVEPIKEEVAEWNKRLVLFQETLDEWITMQRKWMYLETIFCGGDIAKQLPSETKLFTKIDKYWKDTMVQTYDNPDAMSCGTYSGRKETMLAHNYSLDRIEKSLEEYLETKRQIFPRFYFLSNDELLEILADSKNPHKVQPHLRKCFDNIYQLELLNDKSVTIKSMISGEGERVALGKNLKCGRKPVEEWLGNLQVDMKKTLKKLIKNGVIEYEEEDRTDWIMNHKAQIVMSVSQIMWCKGTEDAICNNALTDWLNTNIKQINDLIVFVRGSLKKTDRKKIVALVTTDVHSRDVINKLMGDNCESIMDFNWQKQLRFYWDFDADDCIVKQISAVLNYGYEYMGISSRLVITPLTDRCWITVTGALSIKLGASPAGPAGTGKTESVKDLAKGLGIQCVVFNCSDQIDYKMMAKLFSGLAQAGSWTCLDEFNRIQIEVLSVVAQQLLCIRQALLAGLSVFNFNGNIIGLSTCFGVNITMNPGYAGRTALPDNLKVLFRPVAMMIPDYGLIAEIMLFAEGFSAATLLSKKMVKLYKLSSEQLSQQDHYDFGMRAVKSVLVMAGTLKRSQPDIDESIVLIRAMRDSNIPKFLTHDLPLFNAIVSDLFPSVNIPDNDYGELQDIIIKCILKRNLQAEPCFITKIIQLFDTFDVRFGVMLVGPTGGGKTEIYNILSDAMTYLKETIKHKDQRFQKVHLHILNPKSISMGELYGEMNLLTQEWTDGLASSIMRESIRDTSDDKHWVVFDGPVDTLWIESMNTVLDDNMTLCLANGERIKLKAELRMLFEVRDLAVASPATVSRCGMVYVPSDDLGVTPFIKSFFEKEFDPKHTLSKVSDAIKAYILDLFLTHIQVLIAHKRDLYHKQLIKVPIYSHDIALATSCCYLFESLLSDTTHSNEEILKVIIEKIFVFCVIWTIGGNIDEGRHEFSEIIVTLFAKIGFPKNKKIENTVFDYCIDSKTNQWILWRDYVVDFEYQVGMKYTSILVPTLDTYRYAYLVELLFDVHYSVFLTGESGVGKTSISNNLIQKLKNEKNIFPIILNFSAQTSAKSTQFGIEKKLQKRTKTKYGGPSSKKVMIFIDDINMPTKEEFGAQPPIELLRQFQDFRGFYDREKWFFKEIVDSTIVCSAAPPGGGRSKLTERFTRHFNVLCVPSPSIAVLTRIFSSILGGYLENNGFKSDIQLLCKAMVASTIDLYSDITQSLLPIPAKAHYTFNLRDISKVFQGVLMCSSNTAKNKEMFVRLWIHESMRCFHDRLINDDDRNWFCDSIMKYLETNFKIHSMKKEEIFDSAPIIWGDFFKRTDDRVYHELEGGITSLNAILCGYLEDYNMESSSPMNLVFFDDAMKHLVRISRILRQERGNAMLVGVGGSGRQSLTKLACFILEYNCFQIELRRGYDYIMFRDDLKELMMSSGAEGKQTVFLFNDTQIIDERFIEDINNILNSGEVPNLFTENDEFQRIDDALHPYMKENDIAITPDATWNTFVQRIRDNLHLVLCFSPVGHLFRTRCRMFPSLINCCTIDWYSKWPKQALLSVSNKFLSDLELPTNQIKENLCLMCEKVHSSVQIISEQFFNELRRKVYTTPKSYLDMIKLYLKMLETKRQELGQRRKTLYNGLKKLEEANSIVATLQDELTKLAPLLVVKQKEAAALLEKIAVDQAEADKVKEKVEAEAKIVSQQAEKTKTVQQDAQYDLDRALPALDAASKALKSLNKSDISEVKGMAKPPAPVVLVLEAVMLLLKEKTAWDNAKKVMASASFLKTLQEFDKDNIPVKTVQSLKKKYTSDTENFSVERMQKVSVAATALCKWVHAMVLYSEVAKTVEPKRQRLAEMNKQLDEANAVLKTKQDALQQIIDKVTALKKECDSTLSEKQKLEFESTQCKERLQRAEQLTVGLAEEQIRWKEQEAILRNEIDDLVGDVFISSAFVSYAAPFTGVFRENLISIWMNNAIFNEIPHTEISKFSFTKILGNPLEIRKWNTYGLPTDEVSIQSAIIASHGERWPLMIDPQNQSKSWIKNMEKANNLHIVKLDDPNLLRTLEIGIRNGEPVLIEDIGESLDPSIDPILNKATFKNGGRTLIHLGDSDIDYDENFRFYISTKLSNPHYLPEISIKVTLINFTVTKHGLTEQLLGDVVKKERPEIDAKRSNLIKQMAEDKQELKNIENTILTLLSESKGNILDDVVLIDTLTKSKKTSAVINQRVKESEKTEKMIEETRSKYHCVAKRGAIIFFVIADMALIDPMYQYSLSYFNKLFNSTVDHSEKTDDLEKRLQILQNNITFQIYSNICRGLFERHKLTFSFLICANIMLDSKLITQNEWMYFLRGDTKDVSVQSPDESLISNKSWEQIVSLETSFNDIFCNLSKNISSKIFNSRSFWKELTTNKEPHSLLFNISNAQHIHKSKVSTYKHFENMSSFQLLMLLKTIKYEKIVFGISQFVEINLGKNFVCLPPTELSIVFKDTDKTTPIIFVLSTGADPQTVLLRFAKDVNYENRLHNLSLGQGQGIKAEKLINAAKKNGDWVCLQNCHLAKSWMPSLEKIVIHMTENPDDVHDDFRLWLTSMPCDYFPVPVLQNGVKLTNEPPRGIRSNLMRSYASINCGDFDNIFGNEIEKQNINYIYRRLLFSLSFFHAILQERRKFGSLGFNKSYGFNDSDLETSMTILRMFLNEINTKDEIPWDALRYVVGEINYGGRVTDDWDRRCVMTILNSYYTSNVLNKEIYSLSKHSQNDIYKFDDGDLMYYKDYINNLPSNDDPIVFGMHENANITYQTQETNAMIYTVLSIQPRNVSTNQEDEDEDDEKENEEQSVPKTQDEIVNDIASDLLLKLPKALNKDDGKQTFEESMKSTDNGMMDSLTIFLIQEIEKFNKLLNTVSSSLYELKKAIVGEVVMSATLDDIYNDLMNNKVPNLWKNVSYPSLKPLKSWILDLKERIVFINDWLINGKPKTYWISAFFFQQGFITGILQNHSRKYKIPIDTLSFEFNVLNTDNIDEEDANNIDGVYVYGLYLDGAKWDDICGTLRDANIGELYYKMPIVHFIPSNNHVLDEDQCYNCPLYKTSVRAGVLSTTGQSTNYILPIELPTSSNKKSEYWIKRGVALLTQLDD